MKPHSLIGIWVISVTALILSACLEEESNDFDPLVQLEKDLTEIDRYLSDNGIKTERDDLNRIRYAVMTEGDGCHRPNRYDKIRFNYKGKYFTGEVFDQGTNASFKLGELITGWQIGLPLLGEGSKATLYIPSGYAYGISGSSTVPPNTNLIFEIELLEVIDGIPLNPETLSEDTLMLLKEDLTEIDQCLENRGIVAFSDEMKTIRYTLTEEGEGKSPEPDDSVQIRYTETSLVGEVLYKEEGTFKLSELMEGLRRGLLLMKENGEKTLYIPSGYAHGSSGTDKVPPHTNVVIDVTLEKVIE